MRHTVVALMQVAAADARPSEWAGWLGLIVLLGVFGLLAWWLLASPLPGRRTRPRPTSEVLRMRRIMAGVVLLSGVLLRVGAPWDELWHRLYGVPFGQDLLWPPHLVIYASISSSFLLVVYGLSIALGGAGEFRERFRREPLLAALGLTSAYGFAFIPVDVVWHAVIGPDLIAESPPHVVGALSGVAVSLIGVALALSAAPRASWRWLLDRPRATDVLVIGILAVLGLNWLQLLTTGWEWADQVVLGRPTWTYPVTVVLVGVVLSHLALYATRRVGAASALAVLVLAAHAPAVAAYRLLLPPGPAIGAHLLLVPAAVVLDVWYARLAGREPTTAARWAGALLYGGSFFVVALPYVAAVMTAQATDVTSVVLAAAIGLPAVLLAGLAAARIGAWLMEIGQPKIDGVTLAPTTRAPVEAVSLPSEPSAVASASVRDVR